MRATLPYTPGAGIHSVQLEVVTPDGEPITAHPVSIEDLLQQHDHTLDVGNGIALRLEELNAEQEYTDSDGDGALGENDSALSEEDADDNGHGRAVPHRAGSTHDHAPPPGTHATNDWYDVLNALRHEQAEVERTAAEVEEKRQGQRDGDGRLVGRHPNTSRSAATPLKRFSNAASTETKSIAGDSASAAQPPPPTASRHDVWASFAPPKDTQPHNYKSLRYVSYMGALDYRRFRPTALAFHAAASYLNRKDRGQRFLVYGGISCGARSVEQELYEFSVLTGNWRRIEGRQLVPAGHYGHTLTVVEALDRIVVVGGIGPGGTPVSHEMKSAWLEDPLRAPRYQHLCPLLRRGGIVSVNKKGSSAPPLGIGAPAAAAPRQTPPPHVAAAVGFVSLLFDMNLGDQCWRAIQPAQPFPLAYHTAVHFGKEIFVFGGLTEELRVSGQLLAIDPETYAVRVIQAEPKSRRSRSSTTGTATAPSGGTQSESAADAEDDDEAAGPGPRFLHSAVRYGPYMIVFGGYDTHNEVLSDCWAFDMANERWERLRCRGEAAGRAGHECCVVGSRMLVMGGFECSLEYAGTTTQTPAAGIMELSLVPTTHGEHLWRVSVKVHPALPPLAFTRCAPCGEDHSCVLFGGLTQMPRRARSKSAGQRSASAAARRAAAAEGSENDSEDAEADEGSRTAVSAVAQTNQKTDASAKTGHKGLLARLVPFDDGLVFTFPIKQHHHKHADSGPVVNALGVEIDPNELPEHFKTFVRRQEDFIKKREVTTADVVRKTTLEEQESMEPTLYLTEEEIDLLLHKSEECCVAFAQRYPMDTLPSNVPDREERVHLIEECISESRQVRDVVKSMKGSAPGVTAVKSKSHRKRAGQKFEDYSAAKPFRRVVVVHLLESINGHLARMHRLNKALRTVDWEAKDSFLEAVDDMQNSVHAVSRAINGVVRKYIQHRVDSLMKGVDKHKETMRLLTQVVEKNRHDKIWGVEEARDAQRQQKQRTQAAVGSPAAAKRSKSQQDPQSSTSAKGRQASQHSRSPSGAAAAAQHSRGPRSRSLGGGYFADESKAVVYLMDREWEELLTRTQQVERCAGQLQRYCLEGMAVAGGPAAAAAAPISGASTAPLAQAENGQPSLPIPSSAPIPSLPPPPALSVPPPPMMTTVEGTGLPLPAPSAAPGTPAAAVGLPPPSLPSADGAAAAAAPAEAGAARPRDIVIQHSNELRSKTAAVAEEVGNAASAFYTTLTQGDAAAATAHLGGETDVSSSSSASLAQAPALPAAAAVASLAVAAPPAPAQPEGPNSRSSSSTSRTSSSSAGGSSRSSAVSPHAPPDAHAGPAAVSLPQQLPPPITAALGLPPPPLAGAGGGVAAPAEVLHPVVTSPPARHEAPSKRQQPAQQESAAPSPPAGHALYLGTLRPLLASKEVLLRFKEKVSLIRKNDWDGNDLAGAPQDAKVEELYHRLEKLVTAVAQCVTANFLTKAGARPPRVRPQPVSVRGPPAPAAKPSSRKTKIEAQGHHSAGGGGAALSLPPPSAPPQHASLASSSSLSSSSNGRPDRSVGQITPQGGAARAGETAGLRPLPTGVQCDEEWWKTPSCGAAGSGGCATAAASNAAPLVSAEVLLRDVRLTAGSTTPTAQADAPASGVSIQPVFHNVQTVPNGTAALLSSTAASASRAPLPAHSQTAPRSVLESSQGGPWSPSPSHLYGAYGSGAPVANTSSTQPPVVSLSVAPRVVMPPFASSSAAAEAHGVADIRKASGATLTSPTSTHRRRSTIAELTQLPAPSFANAMTVSGGFGSAAGKEPITSITGGNFVVNTEYLYRVAPHTCPSPAAGGNADAGGDAFDPFHSGAAQNAWADVDEDYFYFGRPAEKRVAPTVTGAVVSGPPYVQPTLMAGEAGVSPPIGTVLGSHRMNAELMVARGGSAAVGTSARVPASVAAARTSSANARRSMSGRRVGDSYRSTTASQAQKAQTSRPVRKEGSRGSSFYTPGELQLMQARERLRAKPQKQQ